MTASSDKCFATIRLLVITPDGSFVSNQQILCLSKAVKDNSIERLRETVPPTLRAPYPNPAAAVRSDPWFS